MSSLFLWMIRMRSLQKNGRTESTTGTHVQTPVSVQSSPPLPSPTLSQNLPCPSECPVSSPRGEATATFVRVSDAVPSPSPANTQISPPLERDSHSVSRGLVVVPPKKVLSCCLVPTLFPCISPVWSAVTTSVAPTNGSSVVGEIGRGQG